MHLHFFSTIVSYVEAGAMHGGYAFLLIISILEAIPLLGTTLPGHTAVIISGFLAKIGIFNIWIVFALASLGAVIGDSIGYYLGKRYGMGLIDRIRPYFAFKDEYIEKTRALVGTHTGKAMIIGRFNPLTRAFMPFVVGASHADVKKFWIYNLIGGISWSVSSVMIGYIFGMGYQSAAGYFGKLTVAAVIFGILVIWGYRFVNMRFHVFRKYELFVLGLSLVSFWSLAKMIQDTFSGNPSMPRFDVAVNIFMAGLNSSHHFIVTLANIASTIGGTVVTTGLGILLGLAFLWKKKWRSGTIMLVAVGSAGFLVESMKAFFMVDRPSNALQTIVGDPSFPSGHATMIAAFLVAFAYLFAPKIHSWVKREWFIVFCTLAIVAVGVSRLVLNVHWASDVIAGWSLGIFCTTATILMVRYIGALVVRKKID